MNYRLLLIESLILKVQAYLHGEISLALLENWVSANIREILKTEDRDGIYLANSITLLYTHLEEKVVSEEEVRVELQESIEKLEDVSDSPNTASPNAASTAAEDSKVVDLSYSFA